MKSIPEIWKIRPNFRARRSPTTEKIELHHTEVEFSMSAGVDITKFATLHPDLHIENDDDFARFVESEHNLTCLCRKHHTGIYGIHVIPYPIWQLYKFCKEIPAKVLVASQQPHPQGVPSAKAEVGLVTEFRTSLDSLQ